MAIEFKPNVNLKVSSQILEALKLVESIFARYGFIPVVTSANDSTHTPGSLHYVGEAVDIRSKGLPGAAKTSIYADLKNTFPVAKKWFVDLEALNGPNEHFHIQRGLAIHNKISGKVVGYAMPD